MGYKTNRHNHLIIHFVQFWGILHPFYLKLAWKGIHHFRTLLWRCWNRNITCAVSTFFFFLFVFICSYNFSSELRSNPNGLYPLSPMWGSIIQGSHCRTLTRMYNRLLQVSLCTSQVNSVRWESSECTCWWKNCREAFIEMVLHLPEIKDFN